MTLTPEFFDAALDLVRARGFEPRHDCRFDGHVVALGADRCLFCGLVGGEVFPPTHPWAGQPLALPAEKSGKCSGIGPPVKGCPCAFCRRVTV